MGRLGDASLPIVAALALVAVVPIAQGQETNTLGMKLVPVPGTKVLMATTEVTVDQYKAAGLGYEAPDFAQSGNHPAVNVSWNDAKKYCAWLSKKEGKKYRLPTDREWSCAVGIGNLESAGGSPESKDGKVADVFPWGRQGKGSPPPKGAGNYMGQEWRKDPARAKAYFTTLVETDFQLSLLLGYDDGWMFTAPVGSYTPNNLGIYDLGGNVREWCEDKYSPMKPFRVLRGGSWNNNNRDNLTRALPSVSPCGLPAAVSPALSQAPVVLSSYRNNNDPENRNVSYGFRVVCKVR